MFEGIFAIVRSKDMKAVTEQEMATFCSSRSFSLPLKIVIGTNVGLAYSRKKLDENQETESVRCNSDHSIWCICLGEIHNFKALYDDLTKKGLRFEANDAELAIHLYEIYGESFVKKINGLFSYIIHDANKNIIVAGKDRFGGGKPLYYAQTSKGVLIGSSIKGFLAMDGERAVDYKAMGIFLKYAAIPSPYSIFRHIRKLEPGQILSVKDNVPHLDKIWNFVSPSRKITDEAFAVNKYNELFEKAIHTRLNGTARIGFLLSGGLDSSSIVAKASKQFDHPISTFTVSFDGHPMDESPFAAAVAEKYSTQHHKINLIPSVLYELPRLIWHLEEPFLESGLLLGYTVYKAAAEYADVILVGDGSDQLFGTEGRSMAIRSLIDKTLFANALKKLFFLATDNPFFVNGKKLEQIKDKFDKSFDFNRWFTSGFSNADLRDLFPYSGTTEFNYTDNLIDLKLPSFDEAYRFAANRFALRIQLSEIILRKSVSTAGLCGLSIRAPFLDNEVVDFVHSLSVNLRNHGSRNDHILGKNRSKYIHRLAMKDVLPPTIKTKSKQGGFVPLALFLDDKEVRNIIFKIIEKSRILPMFFKKHYLTDLMQHYNAISTSGNYWFYYLQEVIGKILHLLALEIWYRQFMENGTATEPKFDLRDYIS